MYFRDSMLGGVLYLNSNGGVPPLKKEKVKKFLNNNGGVLDLNDNAGVLYLNSNGDALYLNHSGNVLYLSMHASRVLYLSVQRVMYCTSTTCTVPQHAC